MENDNKDVGYIEDAAMVLQNQTAAEGHAEMSYIATKNNIFLEMKDMIRKDRSTLLYSLIQVPKAQEYCLVKHLSCVAQGYKELAARKMEVGEIDQAKEYLDTAGRYEALMRVLIEDTSKKGGKRK